MHNDYIILYNIHSQLIIYFHDGDGRLSIGSSIASSGTQEVTSLSKPASSSAAHTPTRSDNPSSSSTHNNRVSLSTSKGC